MHSEAEDELASPPELSPLLNTLENLILTGSKDKNELFPLSLQAAAAVEVGLVALYPSTEVCSYHHREVNTNNSM